MKVRSQNEHVLYNSTHYPGTRQMCAACNQFTDRCEEDDLYVHVRKDEEEVGPLCWKCYEEISQTCELEV